MKKIQNKTKKRKKERNSGFMFVPKKRLLLGVGECKNAEFCYCLY